MDSSFPTVETSIETTPTFPSVESWTESIIERLLEVEVMPPPPYLASDTTAPYTAPYTAPEPSLHDRFRTRLDSLLQDPIVIILPEQPSLQDLELPTTIPIITIEPQITIEPYEPESVSSTETKLYAVLPSLSVLIGQEPQVDETPTTNMMSIEPPEPEAAEAEPEAPSLQDLEAPSLQDLEAPSLQDLEQPSLQDTGAEDVVGEAAAGEDSGGEEQDAAEGEAAVYTEHTTIWCLEPECVESYEPFIDDYALMTHMEQEHNVMFN